MWLLSALVNPSKRIKIMIVFVNFINQNRYFVFDYVYKKGVGVTICIELPYYLARCSRLCPWDKLISVSDVWKQDNSTLHVLIECHLQDMRKPFRYSFSNGIHIIRTNLTLV